MNFGGVSMPPPKAEQLDLLLALLADPAKSQKYLQELKAATSAHAKAQASAVQAQRKLAEEKAAHEAAVTKEAAAHREQLDRERAAWNAEQAKRLGEIERMETATKAALETAMEQSRKATQERKAYEVKVAKINEAWAA
jgi:hypothetical protein